MPINIRACAMCNTVIRDELNRTHANFTEEKGKFTFHVLGPSTWKPDSLAMLCWESFKMPYHGTVWDKANDTIGCTNKMKQTSTTTTSATKKTGN